MSQFFMIPQGNSRDGHNFIPLHRIKSMVWRKGGLTITYWDIHGDERETYWLIEYEDFMKHVINPEPRIS